MKVGRSPILYKVFLIHGIVSYGITLDFHQAHDPINGFFCDKNMNKVPIILGWISWNKKIMNHQVLCKNLNEQNHQFSCKICENNFILVTQKNDHTTLDSPIIADEMERKTFQLRGGRNIKWFAHNYFHSFLSPTLQFPCLPSLDSPLLSKFLGNPISQSSNLHLMRKSKMLSTSTPSLGTSGGLA